MGFLQRAGRVIQSGLRGAGRIASSVGNAVGGFAARTGKWALEGGLRHAAGIANAIAAGATIAAPVLGTLGVAAQAIPGVGNLVGAGLLALPAASRAAAIGLNAADAGADLINTVRGGQNGLPPVKRQRT